MKRRLAWGLGLTVLAALALIAAAPALIDRPAVRAEIQRRLSHALGGDVSWQALEVSLLPSPHGELRGLRIDIPGKLAAAADDVKVYVRLWPLLRGRAEIASVALQRPRIQVIPATGQGDAAPLDAVALYRAAMEPAARALRDFAPDMEFTLEDAAVEIGTQLTLRDLRGLVRTDGKGVKLELAAASNLWKRLSVEGQVEYADLSARAAVSIDSLIIDKDVPAAAVQARLDTDAKSTVECEFSGTVGSLAQSVKGKLVAPAGAPPALAAELGGVDLAQALAIARRKGVNLDLVESAEGKLSARTTASLGPPWKAHIDVVKSDAAVKLTPLPWKLSAHAAQLELTKEDFRVAHLRGALGNSTFSEVAAQIDLPNRRLLSASGRAVLELGEWLPWLQTRLALEDIAALSGSVDVALKGMAMRFDRPQALDFDAVATPHKVSASLKALPVPLGVTGGSVRATRARLQIAGLGGSLGHSSFSDLAAQVDLKRKRLLSASGRATLELGEWFAWLKNRLPLEEIDSVSGSMDVALQRMALAFDRPAAVDFDALATPRNVKTTVKGLPDAVSITGGRIHAGARRTRLEGVAVATLDAAALVSGVTSDDPALELSLAEGVAGEKVVRWALERAAVSPRLEPRTPFRFAARRIAWAPKAGLEADASIEFDGGPELGIAAAWRPKLLELRRLAIKDAASDAVLSANVTDERIQASFAGTLQARSIAAMLREPPAASGIAQGELRLTVDRARRQESFAEGKLSVRTLDLSWLAGRKALVERAELTGERTAVRIAEAQVSVEDQVVRLSGEIRRSPQGPVIEARLESPGVVLERLLPAAQPAAPASAKEPSAIWPLPVTGRIEVRSRFVEFPRHRVEPFEGTLSLEPRRVRLVVKEAKSCGVSFPLEFEAAPEELSASASISMRDEPLEKTMRCLTGDTVDLTGNADLRAELRTRGQRADLMRNLTGTAQAEVRKGRVKKFPLLGRILSVRGITSLGEMEQEGFPYRSMTAKGHFEGGAFMLEEGFFDSDAARIAANGRVDLVGEDSHLTVLIGLLTTVERVVGAVPLIGEVFGGTMVAVPMAVNGDIRDPQLVPLGPRAVTNQLLGIFERTLKLPGKLLPAPQEAKP